MKPTIDRVRGRIRGTLLTPYRLRRMRKGQSALLCRVAAAINLNRRGDLTDNERPWIEAIERLRGRLEQSRETVLVPDYGAGSPQDSFSEEEMRDGNIITEIVGDACRNYSKPRIWATLLFYLIRQLKPKACIELGACLGISACYEAAALEINGAGKLVTMEGAESFADIARRNIESLALSHRATVITGRFQDRLDEALEGLGEIDYAFIDGHHDERATVNYFEKLFSSLSSCAVVVFDDISWSTGMMRAWQRIKSDSRVDISIDLSKVGVCLFGAGVKDHYKVEIT
jgi:predicted O-methyltransferase YrrM